MPTAASVECPVVCSSEAIVMANRLSNHKISQMPAPQIMALMLKPKPADLETAKLEIRHH